MSEVYYVYILSNLHHTVFYIGVTNDLMRRVYEHKNKLIKGFSQRYNIDKLLYYEVYENVELAIRREKQIKRWARPIKCDAINRMNPEWRDLYYAEQASDGARHPGLVPGSPAACSEQVSGDPGIALKHAPRDDSLVSAPRDDEETV